MTDYYPSDIRWRNKAQSIRVRKEPTLRELKERNGFISYDKVIQALLKRWNGGGISEPKG